MPSQKRQLSRLGALALQKAETPGVTSPAIAEAFAKLSAGQMMARAGRLENKLENRRAIRAQAKG
ncbi:MAG: hypothetical protein SNJ67_08545 [Chloracidobacterium sp.]|uniref:Uncharacterized protein n=1 Tax=Chloracidobacterium validum TaxID=2821543 RepID=A0ABX8B5G7_9BACT|nr:hypothetical protein [Chloracidobacterium validum]QUW02212.1 hypothetical protein J8C06_07535 [Chloracidobacterium validum]